jgi:hypothetical protein
MLPFVCTLLCPNSMHRPRSSRAHQYVLPHYSRSVSRVLLHSNTSNKISDARTQKTPYRTFYIRTQVCIVYASNSNEAIPILRYRIVRSMHVCGYVCKQFPYRTFKYVRTPHATIANGDHMYVCKQFPYRTFKYVRTHARNVSVRSLARLSLIQYMCMSSTVDTCSCVRSLIIRLQTASGYARTQCTYPLARPLVSIRVAVYVA